MSEILQKNNPNEIFNSPEVIKARESFEYNLKFKKAKDKFPKLKWNQVSDKIFPMSTYGTDEIDLFLTPSALPYFNVENIRAGMQKDGVYERIFSLAGFEEKLEDGIHKMIDKKTGKEIDPYSKEYFDAWQEIMFYEVYRFINNSSVKMLNKSLYETNSFLFMGARDFNSIRLKHYLSFYKKMEFQSRDTIDGFVERFLSPDIIKGWITDKRFENVGDVATREEYKEYLDKGYIDQKLYDECMELFDLRDKNKIEKDKINLDTAHEIHN